MSHSDLTLLGSVMLLRPRPLTVSTCAADPVTSPGISRQTFVTAPPSGALLTLTETRVWAVRRERAVQVTAALWQRHRFVNGEWWIVCTYMALFYLNGAQSDFILLLNHPLTITHAHLHTELACTHQGQPGVQCLAQGHADIWQKEQGI